jgi:ligand-binding sensor domain-containing protein
MYIHILANLMMHVLHPYMHLLVVFTLAYTLGHSQPYTFHIFSLAEGLPQSQVGCALTDSRGYLWVGTEGGGLCRYNGDRFKVFTMEDQLPSNFIRAMHQQDNYRLWIGTSRGLCSYDGHHFYATRGVNTAITTIIGFRDSTLLVGTTDGLYLLPPGQDSLQPFYLDSIGRILNTYLLEDTAWIGTKDGLWKMATSSSKPLLVARFKGQGIYSIQKADHQSLWLASWSEGIIRFNTRKLKTDTVFSNSLLELPTTIYGPLDGQLWVGTQNNGLVLLDISTGLTTQLTERDGLPHYHIKSIVADIHDQLWVTTSGGGIARCAKQNFRQYTRADGLANNRIYAVHVTPDQKCWMATGNSGIQRLDSSGLLNLRLEDLLHGAKCKSITQDGQGRLWVGTEGRGIVVIDSGVILPLRVTDGLPDDWIQKIVVDKKGTIWVAMYTGGLAAISSDSSNAFLIRPINLPYSKLSSLIVDEQDRIWTGTNDGRLFVIEDGKHIWSSKESSGLPKLSIRSLAFDTFGRIWIGTQSGGVFYGYPDLNEKPFHGLDAEHHLSSQNIYLLLADKSGHLWAGTETGVDKISFQADGHIKEILSFGRNEGFLGIETCHDAASIGSDNKLWFGTMNGLMEYSPGEEIRKHLPPTLHFENISLFYKPLDKTTYADYVSPDGGLLSGLVLKHLDNHISFNFTAVDLDYPDQLVYRWKLNGIDSTWSPPARQSAVSFASLNPGLYTLQVQAATDTIAWSDPIEASFTIETPFWQKASFKIFAGLGMGFIIGLFFHVWTKRLRHREQVKREKLKLQNHLLQLEQKALQLQMNPHFIFNALTSIKSLVVHHQLPEAQEEINAFAQLMRGILNNSRKTSINLSEEAAVLDRYLHLEQLCHQHKFDYKIQLPEGADPDDLELPPMLIQPFVENAVVHGVSHLAHRGQIEVIFQVKDELLICMIRDNGLGREMAGRLREEKKPGHQPVALEVTHERLETLRGVAPYESLKIEDLTNPSGEINGTLVTLKLPLKINW